mmetsp:Transcript_41363/g.88106  ORF Transcript_41363/g.88106 Transcript_41363/m.88106 type:complete len:248 (+) Transcript_41363:3166-3909(+)
MGNDLDRVGDALEVGEHRRAHVQLRATRCVVVVNGARAHQHLLPTFLLVFVLALAIAATAVEHGCQRALHLKGVHDLQRLCVLVDEHAVPEILRPAVEDTLNALFLLRCEAVLRVLARDGDKWRLLSPLEVLNALGHVLDVLQAAIVIGRHLAVRQCGRLHLPAPEPPGPPGAFCCCLAGAASGLGGLGGSTATQGVRPSLAHGALCHRRQRGQDKDEEAAHRRKRHRPRTGPARRAAPRPYTTLTA